jgi:hypothetical protein
MNKCLAKDRFNEPCRCGSIKVDDIPTRFCKFHQYMNEYTKEMLENQELCKGCNKMYYFGNQELHTCTKCQERCEKNREKKKETKILCKKEGCQFKRSKINDYCLKHQICLLENEVKEEGKKLCINYVRGCRSRLESNYPYSRCENCLEKDRKNDYEKRHNIINNTQVKENHKLCTFCCKEHPIENFKGVFGETKTCQRCREQNKIQDAKRDREHRNATARVNDSKPERIEVKKEWKENNYEKVAGYWMKSRQRLIEAGIKNYLQRNAENAKKWRDNNPEKVLQNNENKKQNLTLQYNVYKRTADLKNLDFEISFEEYCDIVKKECYYCGEFSENKNFNGIDRKDQKQGYIMDNCVPSCEMCNMMKNSLTENMFLKRVEHILTYNQLIKNGNFYNYAFACNSSNSISYNIYKKRSEKNKLEFIITKENFIEITDKPCYICGKQNNQYHKNGIDRFDSKKGYILDNCRPCCGECNYMKNNYDYNEMMRKFQCINNNIIKKEKGFQEENITENIILEVTPIIQEEKPLANTFIEFTPIIQEDKPLENTFIEFTQIIQENKPLENTFIEVKPFIQENIKKQDKQHDNKMIGISNKKSVEERRKWESERKKLQREKLRERYGDEEYKKLHAQKIAENRRKKKLLEKE